MDKQWRKPRIQFLKESVAKMQRAFRRPPGQARFAAYPRHDREAELKHCACAAFGRGNCQNAFRTFAIASSMPRVASSVSFLRNARASMKRCIKISCCNKFVTARHVANFCQFFAAAATARCSISATRTPAEVGEPADAFAARAAADRRTDRRIDEPSIPGPARRDSTVSARAQQFSRRPLQHGRSRLHSKNRNLHCEMWTALRLPPCLNKVLVATRRLSLI